MITLAEQAERALRAISEVNTLVLDTETDGTDWKTNIVVGWVLTVDPANNWYIPVRHGGGANLARADDFEKELAKALSRRSLLKIGHNLKFDAHMAANHGVMLGRNLWDTQTVEGLIDEHAGGFSLGAIADRRKLTAKKGEQLYAYLASKFGGKADRNQMANFWKLPGDDPLGVEYALGDGVTTRELYNAQFQDVRNEGLQQITDLENNIVWTCVRMERRGIRVDEARIDELIDQMGAMAEAARLKIGKDFNPRSPKDMKTLCEAAGETSWPKTEKGNPQFNEHYLKTFEKGREVIRIRKLTNMVNSFLMPLKTKHVFKGRVHASLNPMVTDDFGTISGRFSCTSPNLQQVPKRNKELGPLFRSVFVADPGMTFYEADYSQCEPRLFAHYSGDEALVNGYNSVPYRDAHQVVADLLGVERDPTAKRMNMGIFTGMQPRTFAEHMEWPIDKATEAHRAWFATFPGVKNFQDLAKVTMKQRGFVWTLYRRKLRLDDPRFAYRGTSRIIQGGNADIMKYKLLEVDRWLEDEGDPAHLLMTVHDSIIWQSPEGNEEIPAEIVRRCIDVQTPPFNLKVPFVMDVGKGPNWSVATYGGKS